MAYYNGKKVLSVVRTKYLAPNGDIRITANGAYDVESYKRALVSVFPSGDTQRVDESRVAIMTNKFPATAYPKALLNFFGGMCQKVNQLCPDFADTTFTDAGLNINIKNNRIMLSGTATETKYSIVNRTFSVVQSHKYFIFTDSRGTPQGGQSVGAWQIYTYNQTAGEHYEIENQIVTAESSGDVDLHVAVYNGQSINVSFYLRATDLTETYGAGNEPTSTSDSRIRWLIHHLRKHPEKNDGGIANAVVNKVLSGDEMAYDSSWFRYNRKLTYMINMGSMTFGYDSEREKFFASMPEFCANVVLQGDGNPHALCSRYKNVYDQPVAFYNNEIDKAFIWNSYYFSGDKQIFIRDTDYTDPTALKNSLDGVYLVFELESPVVRVDLGSLNWYYSTINGVPAFTASLPYLKGSTFGVCTSRYTLQDGYQTTDRTIMLSRGDNVAIWLIDNDYTDPTALANAISGIYLDYLPENQNYGMEIFSETDILDALNSDYEYHSIPKSITGENVWNEQWEVGEINGTTGAKANTGVYIRSKDYISVKPDAKYSVKSAETIVVYEYSDNAYIGAVYNATNSVFTTPSNCTRVMIATSSGGTTYNHDISITYVSRLIGDNIWDENYVVGAFGSDGVFNSGADAISSANFIPVKSSAHYHYQVGTGGYLVILYYDANQTLLSVLFGEARNQSYKTPENARFVKFSVVSGYGTTYHDDIVIKRDFVAPDGYGLGLSLFANNYIGLERKKFVKKVAVVDMGTLDYTINEGVFMTEIDGMKPAMGVSTEEHNVLSPLYSYDYNLSNDMTMGLSTAPTSRIWFRNDAYNQDVASFKSAMSGVYLVFELETPVETDISEDLAEAFDAEDIITIYPSGSVEFQNDNDLGSPYSLSYQYQVE